VQKGRLGPGKVIAIDTKEGRLLDNDEVKAHVAGRKPYGEWCAKNIFLLTEHAKPFGVNHNPVNILDLTLQQIIFGWDNEELREILKPMATTAAEPVGSMGDDTPLAVLSKRPRLLADYFKQLFAQVTNPPIDSIREKIVMSLSTYMGRRLSWLEESEAHAKLLRVDSPFLLDYELTALQNIQDPAFRSETIFCHFNAQKGPGDLEDALDSICQKASEAIDAGKFIIVLSDRFSDAAKVPIPMLLAIGAVHHHLIREGKRMRASIVCESGATRDVHHFACLVAYGASAVNPYIAIDTIRQSVESGEYGDITLERAIANFRAAIESGMLKIMSKMGISTIGSYRGAQMFEAIGVSQAVIDRCFFGTTSQIGGISLMQIGADALRRHQQAYGSPEASMLDDGGNYRVAKGGRANSMPTIRRSC